MRTATFLLSLLFSLCSLSSLFAQKLIALHHEGAVSYHTDLDAAYNASVSGDTLYLPGGSFGGFSLQKSLTIIGVGHHPDSTAATGSTVLSDLSLYPGADNSLITGIYLNATLYVNAVSNVSISRCFLNRGIYFGTSCSNWIIWENWIGQYFSWPFINSIQAASNANNLNNFFIANNVMQEGIAGIYYSIISNNILLSNVILGFSNTVQNNIFHANITGNSSNTQWFNNLNSGINGGPDNGNTGSGNYLDGLGLSSIFVYSPNNTFYQNDFHVVNPAYLGNDGTPVGIYGGPFPWKDGSLPFTPHIRSKTIGGSTNPDGTLNINITVKAQGN